MKCSGKDRIPRYRNRIEVIQHCLETEVLPRLLEDMPKPRSDRQRASLRVTINYIATLMAGNSKWLAAQKRLKKKDRCLHL